MKSTIRIAATETESINSSAFFPAAPPAPLLTEKDVCSWLLVSKRNLFCWRKAGIIPYIKIGRAVRLRRNEVERALAAGRQNHGNDGD